MARNGSRAIMNDDESGVIQSPAPAPISCVSDLAMPKLATLGFCVRSVICAHAGAPHQIVTPPEMRNKNSAVNFKLASFIGLLLQNYFRTPGFAMIFILFGGSNLGYESQQR